MEAGRGAGGPEAGRGQGPPGDPLPRARAERGGRDLEIHSAPLIYGNIQATAEEAAVMSLPPKFTTFGAIKVEEIEVAGSGGISLVLF